jgi:hypothetical protein
MCLFNLRQESWREPIAEVSERATNDNSAWEIATEGDVSVHVRKYSWA